MEKERTYKQYHKLGHASQTMELSAEMTLNQEQDRFQDIAMRDTSLQGKDRS